MTDSHGSVGLQGPSLAAQERGVQGIAQDIAGGGGSITDFIAAKTLAGPIPDRLHGFKLVVEETGSFRAGG